MPGDLALKMAGIFGDCSGLRVPGNRARKILQNSGKIRRRNSGEKTQDENSKNSGNKRLSSVHLASV